MLKKLLLIVCLTAPLAVVAQEKKMTAQQTRMAACNKEAGEKKLEGDARKGFMAECLKAKPQATAAATARQERMKSCNKDAGAKNLKGDERKKFMSECLKG